MMQKRPEERRIFFRYAGSDDGATMVEFAVAFPVFLFFFMGLMEIGLITFGNAVIDNMMNQVARQAMVGCQRNEFIGGTCDSLYAVTPSAVRNGIRNKSYGLVNACNRERFTISAEPIDSFDFANPNTSIMDLGQGNELVVYHVQYNWPVFTPYLKLRDLFGEFIEHKYATVVRNERFGSMGLQRTFDSAEACGTE